MSGADNWIKLYRWWQDHLKFHHLPSSSSSTIINSDYLIHSRPSLVSSSSSSITTKNSHVIKIKKRSSCAGMEECQVSHNDFRHVRDSIRGRNPRTTQLNSIITTKKRLVRKNT